MTDFAKLFSSLDTSTADKGVPETARADILRQIREKETEGKKVKVVSQEKAESSRRRPKRSTKDDPERLNRTIFVGNVPSKCCTDKKLQKELKTVFSRHGKVESLRFRSLSLDQPMSRKHAFISGQISDKVDSVNVYVVFAEESAAQASIAENARVFQGHHLKVDIAGAGSHIPSYKKSVFIGNLPLDVSEEAIWSAFADCGEVTGVRLVRDKRTGIGKGFAYVAFKDRATVKLALMMDGTDISGRKARIQKCVKPGETPAASSGRQKQQLQKTHPKGRAQKPRTKGKERAKPRSNRK